MDLFVPALALNPCADKAHCTGKAGRLAKQGNAGSARIVHAYREIAAGAPRSPCRLTS